MLNGSKNIILVALFIFMCSPGQDGTKTITWLKDTPSIGSWQQARVQVYQGEELYDIINGGATLYLDHGLSTGVWAVYTAPGGKGCEVFCHLLKDRSAAQKLFGTQQENLSQVTDLEGYDLKRVRASRTIGATLIFGWQGRCFYELNVSGCKNFQRSVNSVAPFLKQLI